MLGYACPTKAAGESRYERVAAAEGERLTRTSRISQAKGPRAGGRPGEFDLKRSAPTG